MSVLLACPPVWCLGLVSSSSASFHVSFTHVSSITTDDDTDDILSGANTSSEQTANAASAAAERRLLKLQETLFGLDEYSSEKRSTRREATLRGVYKALTQHATGQSGRELVYSQATICIVPAVLFAIRNGQPAEQYAACRVLEATSVVLGAIDVEWCATLQEPLRRVVLMTTRAVPVRMAALRALAMAHFMSDDDEEEDALLTLCEQLAAVEFRNETTPLLLRATALDCWALLATTMSNLHLAGEDDIQMGRGLRLLALLKECLETVHGDLRSAAGQCVALIHEARLEMGIDDEDGENVTARRFRRGSWDGTEWEVLMDEVKQQVAELAVESSRHMSKKAKKQQRATFRDYMATIVDDEAPEDIVSFRNGSITLNSWREIIQLNFVRHCLQSGFQIQLLTNETLQTIFGANGQLLNAAGNMSQLEKRLILSKTSEAAKNADIKLTRQRRKRENIKNHFLTADGEDI